MRQLALALLSACIFSTAHAQNKILTTPLMGTAVLKDIPDNYNATIANLEAPEVEGASEQRKLADIKKESKRLYPYKKSPAAKITAATLPTMGLNFIADSNTQIPPDNYMAINKNRKSVSVINGTICIHDANTGRFLYRKDLKSFSSAVGLNSTFNDYRFDPKVIYDPEADRFICVMLNSTKSWNYIVLAFSKTNDPAGAWNFYKLYGDYNYDTSWFDYPAISITKNDFFLTGNKIKNDSSWQAGFKKTLIYQIRKREAFNGDSVLPYQIWDNAQYNGKFIRCLHPVKAGDQLAARSQYFLSTRNFDITNDTVFLVKIPDSLGAPGTLSITPIKCDKPYGVPPNGRQPDTTATLATNDGRVLGAFMHNNEIQFVSTSINTVNGNSAIYHGIISNVATTPTCQGKIVSVDSLDYGYPNITFAGTSTTKNQAIISCNFTGPRTFPGVAAIYFDGTDYSNPLMVKRGFNSIKVLTQKEQRWGDYMGSQIEWGATGVVWIEGIYGRSNRTYGCYMAQIKAPTFTGIPTAPQQGTESTLYPNPAWEFIRFKFELATEQLLDFAIYTIDGKLVDHLPLQMAKQGLNELQFNIGSLAKGQYIIKGLGNNSNTVMSQSFIKN